MRVLLLSMGFDTGGQGIRIKQAFDRLAPSWTVRSMAATQAYMEYPPDLAYRRRAAVEEYRAADVVHLRNGLQARQGFDRGQRKPTVLHHHGSAFRRAHDRIAPTATALGITQLVSTIDLEVLEPGLRWLPSPFNLAELAEIRSINHRPGRRIRIAHAPTNRTIKNTDVVLAAVARLAERYPIDMVLIEGRPWRECLALKATADIFVDQLTLGYGNNAIEAWGMGLPVIAGVADPAVRARMVERWGRLPFAEATPETIEARLETLIRSQAARDEWATIGAEHVAFFHDERRVIPLLEDVWNEALERAGRRAA